MRAVCLLSLLPSQGTLDAPACEPSIIATSPSCTLEHTGKYTLDWLAPRRLQEIEAASDTLEQAVEAQSASKKEKDAQIQKLRGQLEEMRWAGKGRGPGGVHAVLSIP